MEPRGLMGGFYRISEWIMRLAVINLLWIITALPFMFLVFFLVFIYPQGITEEALVQHGILAFLMWPIITISVLAPLTLFPSTAAMFTVARKWVTGESDVALFKTFFRGYKENYKQSMIGGFIYTILIVLMVVNYFFYRDQMAIASYIFLAFLALLFASLFNYFSMLVHYHMKTFQLVKNAILITIGKPIRSLSTVMMCGVIIYISLFQLTFLIPFFMGSLVALVAFWNFNLIYMKLQEQAEKLKQSEEEAAEEAAELNREELLKDNPNDSNK
ncbi:DUF624 domain-containing protein [Paenibacillus pinisoli]|uniref:DUF624 domain-containing protein n=1 Tax=Paenibacillus pinisoli TaxID=1276110 RepID=A0A3A6PAQ3_9BACL|nr:DUF624 domain-containing protein [Paenibacillus pinisoli]RJX38212.1 DUF624 domain-containing protein [Paenibacillus pinisoli]